MLDLDPYTNLPCVLLLIHLAVTITYHILETSQFQDLDNLQRGNYS